MPLAGWVWTETRNMKFDTVFCPFTGRPFMPQMFKEQGKGVITTDLLATHYRLAHALIENSASQLDPFDVEILLEPNADKVQLMEGVCNAYGVAPEHGAWLDNVHKNIEKLEDPYKRSLAIAACTRVVRYLLAFDENTKIIMPDDDISGVFNYYVEFFNGKVFDNGNRSEAYNEDSYKLAETVEAEAMYFYIPSSVGFHRLNPERRLLEMFSRYCGEAELDKQLSIDKEHLGATHPDLSRYQGTFELFLEKANNIPLWIISYNRAGVFTGDRLKKVIKKFKSNVKTLTKKVIHSSSEVMVEYIYIAHD